MPRFPGYYDIYDDTRQVAPPTRVPSHHRRSGAPIAPVDPFFGPPDEFRGAMERFHSDIGRAFGFDSMFGDRHGTMGFGMPSFSPFLNDAMSALENHARDGASGGGTYYFESRTRTVGPDGRVHEEVVRTAPDEEGRMRTRRSVRDGDIRDERRSRVQRSPRYDGRRDDRLPDVIVEEVDDEEEERRQRRQRRRPAYNHGDVEVEEIQDGRQEGGTPAEWMRERYRRWRNRA
eukprot:GFKZ01005846.1.p1 GENE.GFKZ01005846.1~~GFKZ01005846.1.p1  ORF type:complete len:232 (+),score=31.30 GFKZ01005846.1:246-941(+)